VALASTNGEQQVVSMTEYLQASIDKKIILYITMPKLSSNYKFWYSKYCLEQENI